MRRVAIEGFIDVPFREVELPLDLIESWSNIDFVQDDTSTATVGPPWPSADPDGFWLDDNGDKIL